MFRFEKEQKIFDLGGPKIGGQPGRYPTVMIGSVFYLGDKAVSDDKKGAFDRGKVEAQIKLAEELSEKTGNPSVIDVVGSFPEALPKYIDFVADMTDSPFLVDGATADVRISGVKHVEEVGLAGRAVYNSIMPDYKQEEIDAIRRSGIRSAILLTYNPKMPTIKGKLETVDGLLKAAEEAGIENTLIDTTILDVPDPGPAGKTIYMIKKKYGLPAGCGAHNAIDKWRKKLDKTRYLINSAVAFAFTIIMGGDFLLYGPLSRASEMFPSVALADAYVAYSMMQEYGIRPAVKDHPYPKIFSL